VDYQWKDSVVPGDTRAQVVILNDSKLYEEMVEDESFDNRIWYYFQDEAEFQRAFDPNNKEQEFYLVREHADISTDKFE
jgi:outer membrane protein assembly factor BamE (lipoprotein component of BamABCDE complex)